MALQLQTVYDAFERKKKDISDIGQSTFAEWCDFMNKQVYRQMIGLDPEVFISTQTYNIISGTSSYALPADFRDIKSFGCGLYYVDDNSDDTNTRRAKSGFGSTQTGFYLAGSNLIMTPEPSNSETWKLRYIPTITTLDALTDYLTTDSTNSGIEIIPDEYLQVALEDLDVLYNRWDENAGAESLADFRFVRIMDEMMRNIKRETHVYNMPDLMSIY